jgi:hypothetical protein
MVESRESSDHCLFMSGLSTWKSVWSCWFGTLVTRRELLIQNTEKGKGAFTSGHVAPFSFMISCDPTDCFHSAEHDAMGQTNYLVDLVNTSGVAWYPQEGWEPYPQVLWKYALRWRSGKDSFPLTRLLLDRLETPFGYIIEMLIDSEC